MAALVTLVALGACAPFHKPLAPDARTRITEVDLRVVVAQQSFMFSAQSSNVSGAMGGGLIGALIDSSVQRSRQKEMAAQIQATVGPLVELDYRSEAASAVEALKRSGTFPLKLKSADLLPGMPPQREHEGRIAAVNAPAYLLVWVEYELAPDLGVFSVRSTAQMWQDGKSEASYRVGVVHQTRVQGDSREQRIKRLTDNEGDRLRRMMHGSMQESLRMIALDLSAPKEPDAVRSGAVQTANVWTRAGWIPVKELTLVDERSERQFLRSADGALLSIGSEVVK